MKFEGFEIMWFPLYVVNLVYSVVETETEKEVDSYAIPVLARGIPDVRMEIVEVLN